MSSGPKQRVFNVAIPEAINVVLEVKKHLQEHKSVETNTNKLAVKSTQTDNIKDLISGLLETAKKPLLRN